MNLLEENVNLNEKTTPVPGLFLRKWWFMTVDFPPRDYDCRAFLEKRNWKLLSLEQWEGNSQNDDIGKFLENSQSFMK